MTIRSTLARSKDDFEPIQTRSFANQVIRAQEVELSKINKANSSDAEKRMLKIEHEEQGAQYAIKITGEPDGLSLNQIRDLFDEMGFNADVTMSEVFGSDLSVVVNIGGYLIPFWKKITSFFSNKWRKILTQKLGPGRKRLHGRLFNHTNGSWYLVAHVDESNWFNLTTPTKVISSHLVTAAGNYELGHKVAITGIQQFVEDIESEVDFSAIYKELR